MVATDPRAKTKRPPRENLVRATSEGFELRHDDAGNGNTLVGHFARFNEWTEIDSMFEGQFMERIAPGAFSKTFKENRDGMQILFNHGHDPQLGDQVLAEITTLREDDQGAYYEGDLLNGIPELVRDGLERGLYGASFRFRVMREEFEEEPAKSDHNPDGLPERTIKEAQVMEFGPVTFPAYAGATAGVRSLTDEFVFDRLTENRERMAELVKFVNEKEAPAPSKASTPAPATSSPERRKPETRSAAPKEAQVDAPTVDLDRFATEGDMQNRLEEIAERFAAINTEYGTRELSSEVQNEWNEMKAERAALEKRLEHLAERKAEIERNAETKPATTERAAPTVVRKVENVFDMLAVRRESRTPEEERRKLRDNARSVVERATFPHPEVDREKAQEHIFKLLEGIDENSAMSRWILATGSELYDRAFGKYVTQQMRTPEEDRALFQAQEVERALSLTGASGGFAIPFQLDPTILATSNGAVNPWRQIARTVTIPGDEWRGVSSAGVTVAYAAEATETTDNAPTLAQPVVSTEKAQAWIPFSIEAGMDWGGLRGEMSQLLQDGKDELEAAKFATGTGTNEPFGVITGATNTVNAAAAGAFTLANLYALQAALPPRYRPRASWAGNLSILQRIRQFDTVGSSAAIWQDSLQLDMPDRLLGRPAYEASAMSAVSTVGALFLIYGDFSRYLIADRIGLTVELVPTVFGTNHRPTGQRGLYAYFRNGAKVLDANAFRVLLGQA